MDSRFHGNDKPVKHGFPFSWELTDTNKTDFEKTIDKTDAVVRKLQSAAGKAAGKAPFD
jgi:hypothetical protein